MLQFALAWEVKDQIPLLAQIVGVVDVYEAVTTQRPYQIPKSPDDALAILRIHVERGWRKGALVDAFAELIRRPALQPAAPPDASRRSILSTDGTVPDRRLQS